MAAQTNFYKVIIPDHESITAASLDELREMSNAIPNHGSINAASLDELREMSYELFWKK